MAKIEVSARNGLYEKTLLEASYFPTFAEKKIQFASYSEAACALANERLIPNWQCISGQTFQVPLLNRSTADFRIKDTIVEYHPIILEHEFTNTIAIVGAGDMADARAIAKDRLVAKGHRLGIGGNETDELLLERLRFERATRVTPLHKLSRSPHVAPSRATSSARKERAGSCPYDCATRVLRRAAAPFSGIGRRRKAKGRSTAHDHRTRRGVVHA